MLSAELAKPDEVLSDLLVTAGLGSLVIGPEANGSVRALLKAEPEPEEELPYAGVVAFPATGDGGGM